MTKERRDWRELCAAIVNEPDPEKMFELAEELLAALEERQARIRTNVASTQDTATND